jgi:hypothetical protein
MLRLGVEGEDLEAGIAFCTGAPGRDGSYVWFEEIGPQAVLESKAARSRLQPNIETDDAAAEGARLEFLGSGHRARVESWLVMLDPCGDGCCVLSAQNQEVGSSART